MRGQRPAHTMNETTGGNAAKVCSGWMHTGMRQAGWGLGLPVHGHLHLLVVPVDVISNRTARPLRKV